MKITRSITIDSTGRLAYRIDGSTVPVVRGGDGDDEQPEATLPEELQAQLDRVGELNDEELGDLDEALVAHVDSLDLDGAESEEQADAVLAEAQATQRAIADVRGEATRRDEAAAEAEQRAADRRSQLDAIRNEVVETEAEGGEGEEAPAEELPPGEGEGPAANPEVPSEPTETPAQAEEQREPVAAAAAPASRPRIGRVAARRAPRRQPRPQSGERLRTRLVAAADVPGFSAGQEVTVDQLPELLQRRIDAVSRHDVAGTWNVASLRWDYPEEWTLGDDAGVNEQRIKAQTNPQALAAAGGYCAPPQPDYSQVQISDNARVVPNALTRFGAGRGGIVFTPPPYLGGPSLTNGVSDWSHTNDVTPSAPATKPCAVIACANPVTVYTDAIVTCMQVGNFIARTFDERVQAVLDLLAATAARHADSLELTRIGSQSTQVVTGQDFGASIDLLSKVTLAVQAEKNRWRMPEGARLRFMAPDYLHEMIRVDVMRQIPGTGTYAEKMAIADATIDAAFAIAEVNVSWLMDSEAGADFGAQGNGALVGWPSTIVGYLFHEGAWTFLDGGELNLGVVRDSTLNATNDFRIFSEVWEQVAFRGIFSRRITFDVCPSGLTQAPDNIEVCTQGS